MKAIWIIVSLLVVMPIWFYLLYQILVAVEANELMWFLYWVYVPVGFLMGALGKCLEYETDEKAE